MITIYTDGSCMGNPGPGGWAAVIVDDGAKRSLSGKEDNTTNNRMEILAAIKGLEAVPAGSEVTVFSDSQYVVNTMTRGWKRNANRDLWAKLDAVAGQRRITWRWTRGHAGNPGNEEANALALRQAQSFLEGKPTLSHLDSQGNAQMVDVSGKDVTLRDAVAEGLIHMKPSTLRLIKEGGIDKGDVLAVARVAGIMAAKRTWETHSHVSPRAAGPGSRTVRFGRRSRRYSHHGLRSHQRQDGRGNGSSDRRQHRGADHIRHGKSR